MKKIVIVLLMLLILVTFWDSTNADQIVSFQTNFLSTPLGNIKHTYIRFYGYGTDWAYFRYANPGSTDQTGSVYVTDSLGDTSGSRAICQILSTILCDFDIAVN